uniref:Uncharacterized protein n=1 Tax=Vitis vinifera TaxID=29760 RepID=F6H0G9_VITVI
MGNDKYRSPTSTMKAKVEEQEEFRGRKALDSSDGPSTQQLAEIGVPDVFSHRQVATPDLVLTDRESNISVPSDSY